MPKLVKEISQGSSNERSVEGGSLADASTRIFRIILNAPNETYDIQDTIGVKIGDPHPVNTSLPCVSLSERAEGESRLVRIVTVNYATSAGAGEDPNSQSPDVRPARVTSSTSLVEMPARKWRDLDGNDPALLIPAHNPVGDIYDGATRLVPMTTVHIDQFAFNPWATVSAVGGNINSDDITVLGLPIKKRLVMFRGSSFRPHVESWGAVLFRGWMATYEFSILWETGWRLEIPVTGLNILNKNLNGQDVENEALQLAHKNGMVDTGALRLVDDLAVGAKCRGMVPVPAPDKKWFQRPCAMPIPLNMDGTPRSRNADPKVLIRRYCTQDEVRFGDNFSAIGIRIAEAL